MKAFVILKFCFCLLRERQTTSEPAEGFNAVVASENPICSDIGLDVIKEGGNAIDATVATTICIGTINFQSSGIGGGGFLTFRDQNGKSTAIDFREMAPAAATRDMFSSNPDLSQFGALSVGVPGELKGLGYAHKKYGSLPWKRLIEPSVALALKGWQVTKKFRDIMIDSQQQILSDPTLAGVMAPNGVLLEVGETLSRPVFAKTLEKIAENGPEIFYSGEIAESLIKTLQERGGIMTLQDLQNYKVQENEPLIGSFRGFKMITAPPPASGGVLLSILNIMEHYKEKVNLTEPTQAHRFVEALKHSYAQRDYYGDPADIIYRNITEITNRLMQKKTSDEIMCKINDSRTFPVEYYKPTFETVDNHGTMHLSIITGNGEAVSLTSTINLRFGSKLMEPNTGILLNNEMVVIRLTQDDFSVPNRVNYFNLAPSPYNYIQPGKRPLSSATPTIIEMDGKLLSCIGASGGSQIISATAQSILRILEMGLNPLSAVHEPRLHHQLIPNELVAEKAFGNETLDIWRRKGHNITFGPIFTGVSVVYRHLSNGLLQGSGDLRKNGSAVAY